MRPSAQHTHLNGFSLLELMGVIALTALVASVAIPGLVTFSQRSALRGEATAIRLFLEQLYAYSLTYREQITISCSEANFVARNERGDTVATYSIKRGIIFDPDSIRDSTIMLHPSISVSPTTIDLTKGAYSCSVIASLRGRFRVTCI